METTEHDDDFALEWSNPPGRDTAYDWERIAKGLRAKPGHWARIFADGRTSVANAVKQGSVKALDPALGFEFRTRNNQREPVRTCDLYGRYNPDLSDDLADILRNANRKEDD